MSLLRFGKVVHNPGKKNNATPSGTTLRPVRITQNLSEVQDSLFLSPLSNEANPNRPPIISESHGDA